LHSFRNRFETGQGTWKFFLLKKNFQISYKSPGISEKIICPSQVRMVETAMHDAEKTGILFFGKFLGKGKG